MASRNHRFQIQAPDPKNISKKSESKENSFNRKEIQRNYSFSQVVRNGFTADRIFGWISIYLANQKIPKIRFLPKSIKINRKNTVLTKIRKVRCPKGRSTALFACQKYLFPIFLPFWHFLAKKYAKTRFYRNFWKKYIPNSDFIGIFL